MKKRLINLLILEFIVLTMILSMSKKTYCLPNNPNEYTKYSLKNGLNIIAIDLGGPENSDRENGAYGDATLIEQNGNYLLIDTGTDDNNNTLINFLKTQEVNNLSIYLSHYHSDHYGKIKDILNDKYFTINKIYLPDSEIISSKLDSSKEWYDTINYYVTFAKKFKNDLLGLGANIEIIKKGSLINIGDATLEVIWDEIDALIDLDEIYNSNPELFKNIAMNNTSIASMINYKGVKFLTAGDIEQEAEKDILEKGIDIKADIFKFSHHGDELSNTEDFVNAINPKYAYFPNNYMSGKNKILWYGDRSNGKYKYLVDRLTGQTNVLSTLYNGNIIYNISPTGIITTDITRNYHTLTVKYVDIEAQQEIIHPVDYYFNDRSIYHLEKLDYKKNISNYTYLSSDYINNDILTEDKEIICYYQETMVGDMNKNNKIDLKDIILLIKKYLKNEESTNEDIIIGDLNYNGKIDLKDIILLIKSYLQV